MATKKKKKSAAAPKKKASARKKTIVRRSPKRKSQTLFQRPEALALGGVVAFCAVAAGVFMTRRVPVNSPQAPAVAVAPVAPVATDRAVLAAEFARASEMPMADRIVFWSAYVQKLQGGKNALAELVAGKTVSDEAPLMPEKFNCTTFVETLAALSRSHSGKEFYSKLLAIRYKNSKATFLTRNHFPEIDWIPNNQKAGILTDVTASVARAGGVKSLTEKKGINRASWLAKEMDRGRVGRSIASTVGETWNAAVPAQVQYISTKDLTAISSHIENGTIVNFVHSNNEKKPVLISHQGYLIREGGTVFLRHASSGGEIRQVALKDYLSRLARDPAFRKWPIVGINLNRLT